MTNARRLRELEAENGKLKRLLTEEGVLFSANFLKELDLAITVSIVEIDNFVLPHLVPAIEGNVRAVLGREVIVGSRKESS